MSTKENLARLGLTLPAPWKIVSPTPIPPSLIRVVGARVFISGHVPTDDTGTIAGPTGRVGAEIDLAGAQQAAIRTVLNILANVQQALGDLDRIGAWCRLHCLVNAAGDFRQYPQVFNPASQLLLDVFGAEIGGHARTAYGVCGLPWDMPVEIAAELELE